MKTLAFDSQLLRSQSDNIFEISFKFFIYLFCNKVKKCIQIEVFRVGLVHASLLTTHCTLLNNKAISLSSRAQLMQNKWRIPMRQQRIFIKQRGFTSKAKIVFLLKYCVAYRHSEYNSKVIKTWILVTFRWGLCQKVWSTRLARDIQNKTFCKQIKFLSENSRIFQLKCHKNYFCI